MMGEKVMAQKRKNKARNQLRNGKNAKWFENAKRRNRRRDKIAKLSRRANRRKK